MFLLIAFCHCLWLGLWFGCCIAGLGRGGIDEDNLVDCNSLWSYFSKCANNPCSFIREYFWLFIWFSEKGEDFYSLLVEEDKRWLIFLLLFVSFLAILFAVVENMLKVLLGLFFTLSSFENVKHNLIQYFWFACYWKFKEKVRVKLE